MQLEILSSKASMFIGDKGEGVESEGPPQWLVNKDALKESIE
jgi:hypothetical protein